MTMSAVQIIGSVMLPRDESQTKKLAVHQHTAL